jgi:hypothetical protein
MYGADPYASVPYAALSGGILVAACIHVASQLLYSLDVEANLVFDVSAGSALVYNANLSTYIC